MIAKQPFIVFVVEDSSGSRDQMHIYVARTASIAEIEAAAAEFRSRVSTIADCVFVSQQIMFAAVELPPLLPTHSTLHTHAGVFIFTCAANEYAVVSLPALNPNRLMPDGLHVNQADPEVAAFIAACIDQEITNPFGMDIESLANAYLQYRP